jgi:cell division protein YceG involved in septum cleavage
VAAAAALVGSAGCGSSNGGTVRVTIPTGSSFTTAVDSLSRAGVISSPRLFGFYASLRKRDRALKAGTYALERGVVEYCARCPHARQGPCMITIPEGLRASSIAPLLLRCRFRRSP